MQNVSVLLCRVTGICLLLAILRHPRYEMEEMRLGLGLWSFIGWVLFFYFFFLLFLTHGSEVVYKWYYKIKFPAQQLPHGPAHLSITPFETELFDTTKTMTKDIYDSGLHFLVIQVGWQGFSIDQVMGDTLSDIWPRIFFSHIGISVSVELRDCSMS